MEKPLSRDPDPILTMRSEDVLGLVENRWPEWFQGRKHWAEQYRALCQRLSPERVFDALGTVLNTWSLDRSPLAIEIEDYMGKATSPNVARHLYVPWRQQAFRPITPEDRAEMAPHLTRMREKSRDAPGPKYWLTAYRNEVAKGFRGSMEEFIRVRDPL